MTSGQLTSHTFSYRRIVQATGPVLWFGLDRILTSVDTTPTVILNWLVILPGMVPILLRMAYKARRLCDGAVERVMIAVGLVTVGAVMFVSCFVMQWFLMEFLIASTSLHQDHQEAPVLATSALLIVVGVGAVLLWRCTPAIKPYSPPTDLVAPARITAEELGDSSLPMN